MALLDQSDGNCCASLIERLSGNSPQTRIASFVEAVVGDPSAAVQLWETEPSAIELSRRPESVVAYLIAADIAPDYMILDIDWWTTCCEPSVICNSREAGGSRITVQFMDRNRQPMLNTFDVFPISRAHWCWQRCKKALILNWKYVRAPLKDVALYVLARPKR